MKNALKKVLACCLVLMLTLSLLSFGTAEGTRTLILYWSDSAANYDTCDVWSWCPGKDGRGYLFEPCDYGVRCVIEVPADVTEVGFIVRRDCSEPGGTSWGSATKDYEDDRFATLTGATTEIFLKAGDGMQYTSSDGGKTLDAIRLFSLAGIVAPDQIRYFISPAVRLESLHPQVLADIVLPPPAGIALPADQLRPRQGAVLERRVKVGNGDHALHRAGFPADFRVEQRQVRHPHDRFRRLVPYLVGKPADFFPGNRDRFVGRFGAGVRIFRFFLKSLHQIQCGRTDIQAMAFRDARQSGQPLHGARLLFRFRVVAAEQEASSRHGKQFACVLGAHAVIQQHGGAA